jgi:hypothetical protein
MNERRSIIVEFPVCWPTGLIWTMMRSHEIDPMLVDLGLAQKSQEASRELPFDLYLTFVFGLGTFFHVVGDMIATFVPIVQQAAVFAVNESTREPLPRQKENTVHFVFRGDFVMFLFAMPLQGFEGGANLRTPPAAPAFVAVVIVVFVPFPVGFSVDDQFFSTLKMKSAETRIAWLRSASCSLYFGNCVWKHKTRKRQARICRYSAPVGKDRGATTACVSGRCATRYRPERYG